MLDLCLPALQRAIAAAGGNHTILVVDDESSDGTTEYLAQAYPAVEVLPLKWSGFARACNSGVMQAKTEIVILLNNDMVVEENFIGPLLEAIEAPEVFAASAKFLDEEGRLENVLGNRTSAVWRQGLMEIYHETNPEKLNRRVPQLYAQGGGMVCRRRDFIDLGGFDTLYEPFYWEDVDLSYRAWKRGWRILYEPNAVCRHFQGRTTARDYSAHYLRLTSMRNCFLFHWKNLTERDIFARHLALIPARAAGDILLNGQGVDYAAVIAALGKLREVAAKRILERSFAVLTDSEVLRRANGE